MWRAQVITKFHAESIQYIEDNFVNKKVKIDCADLALEYLMDFARENHLPVGIRHYNGKA